MRNGEYEGHIRARDTLRRCLAAHLAEWYAGDHDEYRAGLVVGVADAISELEYAGPVEEEIRKATPAAHRLNTRSAKPCHCGTKARCGTSPPIPFYWEYGADDEDEDEDF
jgi:hypothetical protein